MVNTESNRPDVIKLVAEAEVARLAQLFSSRSQEVVIDDDRRDEEAAYLLIAYRDLIKKAGGVERFKIFDAGKTAFLTRVSFLDHNGFMWQVTSNSNVTREGTYKEGFETVSLHKNSLHDEGVKSPAIHISEFADITVQKGKPPVSAITYGYYAQPLANRAFGETQENTGLCVRGARSLAQKAGRIVSK